MERPGLALIMGGEGNLAQAIGAELASCGYRWRGLSRRQCDVTSIAAVGNAIERYGPQFIVNCAGITGIDRCARNSSKAHAVNGEGAGIIASMAKHCNIGMVHVSCSDVLFGSNVRANNKIGTRLPDSVYGRSKLFGEQLVRLINPPECLIVRTRWREGSGCIGCIPTFEFSGAYSERSMLMNSDSDSPPYISDIASTIVELIATGETGTFDAIHSANYEPMSTSHMASREIVEMLIALKRAGA
ncbi:MAG TPA: sugar nucleotide-binding protein [Tepidisphaeraceae bacterium]|nr:sugar nucleotide-binding protein [Tepidisphaeraceae bacterium]